MPDFKSRFCERYQCPPAEFENRAFRKCLYWHARLVAPIIRKIWPDYFERDFELVRYLGAAPGRRHAMSELGAYMEAHEANGGFARKVLCLRTSARNTTVLIGLLFGRRVDPGTSASLSGDKKPV